MSSNSSSNSISTSSSSSSNLTDIQIFSSACFFAAEKHTHQRRKNKGNLYIYYYYLKLFICRSLLFNSLRIKQNIIRNLILL